MAAFAQSEVIPDVMLAAGAADDVMDLKSPSPIGLRPPTDAACPVEGRPVNEGSALGLVHAIADCGFGSLFQELINADELLIVSTPSFCSIFQAARTTFSFKKHSFATCVSYAFPYVT